MESYIKAEKMQSTKKYKRDLILYSLTSMITFLFLSYPFWLPSLKQILYSFPNSISFFFNAKFLFILGNIIIFILIGESRLTRPLSSPASEIYDAYVSRSRISHPMSSNNNFIATEKEDGFVQNLYIGGNLHCEEKRKKEIKVSKSVHHQHEEKLHHEEKKRKEIRVCKSVHHQHEETKSGLRASKSEVWGENEEIVKSKGNEDNLHHEEKMRVTMNMHHQYDQENKRGLRASKSEISGESAIVKKVRAEEKKVEQLCMPTEELNTRVEAFIARVNKQRLLEAKLLRDGRC